MGRAIAIERLDLTAAALRKAASREKDGSAARRILALALVLEGQDRASPARSCAMDRQTLRDWAPRYNQEGLAGLRDRHGCGPGAKLSPAQRAEVEALVEAGPDAVLHKVVRQRRVDLRDEIKRRFGVDLHERTVGKMPVSLGYRGLSVRPQHPKSDPESQEVFKKRLQEAAVTAPRPLPAARHRDATANALFFDARAALHAVLRVDLTQIHGLGPSLALKLAGECGTDLSAWPNAKHFTSWLCLAPSNKISGGKVLSTRTRRSGSRAAALLRLAAVTVGRTQTALGAFYRRLAARVGKAKAVTATARKIAVLFYNMLRHGLAYADPGASYYEERYRARVLGNLQRRAKSLGYVLQREASAT